LFSKITKRQWTLIFLLIITLLIFYFIIPVSIPIILAILTSLMLNPIVRFLTRRFRLNRKLSVTIVFLIFLVVISTIGTYVATKAVAQLVKVAENAPEYINDISVIVNELKSDLDNVTSELPDQFMEQVESTVTGNLSSMKDTLLDFITIDKIANFAADIPGFLINFLVYLIALFLFMIELPLIKKKFYEMMTEETAEKVRFMNARLSSVIFGFMKAQFLVSLIILAVCLIGLFIIAPEVAIIMSLIIWIIDLIPIIGSIIILAPWSLYMYLVGDPVMGTKLAILAIVLLGIRRTVEPKVMGSHMGLSPLVTLIAMFLGLQLIGILGFIVGPLVVIAYNSAKEAGIIKWKIKI
jgi:sporulation integral membrane protein YtvI